MEVYRVWAAYGYTFYGYGAPLAKPSARAGAPLQMNDSEKQNGIVIDFTGGKHPTDRLIKKYKRRTINQSLFIILVSASCIGILMAISFLIFNIQNRASR